MRVGEAYGVVRSLTTYYGQPWRWRRRRAFYGQFIRPGSLCMDIGSHVGDRIRTWLELGARVVAIEPQPRFLGLLRALYGGRRRVELLGIGLAEVPGHRILHVSTRTPTVSTFSVDWIEDVRRDARFRRIEWDRQIPVDVDTLDNLILRYGEPAFCKIDVEGHELNVLQGLSRPLPALSFEYIPVARKRACACIDRLSEVGAYLFRRSSVETMRWMDREWLSAPEIKDALQAMPPGDRSGDVYARLERAW
ncbi:MAG TPA: FkbM family methyltransferase [Myxococcaceae bacterium]|nr:FkbM family methyltransferase [Myxococcaceae bacterium]